MSEAINSIDWEQLDMMADGYTEDFVEIYVEFGKDLPEILSTLETALAAGDVVAASHAAHQAKGSAANFGFAGFSSIMATIEQTAKAGSLDGIAEDLIKAKSVFAESILEVNRERGI